jgi:nucleoside-diphosphate-sugar epimerase
MRVLVTGAAGFLGQGLIVPFEKHGHSLRLMDFRPFTSKHEVVVGSVADLEAVRAAVRGVDAIVIAHMAKNPDAYVDPTVPFDVNVKGTANLFFAAHEAGVRKLVLISSTSAADGHDVPIHHHGLPPKGRGGLYSICKVCQEMIAEQFSRDYGMAVAALRVGCIVDGETNSDKYGRSFPCRPTLLADRRDIGDVARVCLERDDITYEVFNVMSTPESLSDWDVAFTCQRLGWKPTYDFNWLPADPKRVPRG